MKRILFLFAVALFSSCMVNVIKTENHPKKITSNEIIIEKAKATNLLNQWHKDVANADFDAYFNKMSNSSVFIGTDASENWTVQQFKEFAKPFFEAKKTWDFKVLERNIYLNDEANVIWFDELLDTWMGVCRGSGVLLKQNNQWKIEHYVLSVVIPNDDVKKVVAIKKEKDSEIIKNLQTKINTQL